MTEAEETDKEWSLRVAHIAMGTIEMAKPKIVDLTPEQVERCTRIIAEEIFVRLVLGDRPQPAKPR